MTSVTYKRSAAIDLVNGDTNARIYVGLATSCGIPPFAVPYPVNDANIP